MPQSILSPRQAEAWDEHVATWGEPAYGLSDEPEYGLFRCSACYEAPDPIAGWAIEGRSGEYVGLIPQWNAAELQPVCHRCTAVMPLVAKLKPVPVSEHVPASDVPNA